MQSVRQGWLSGRSVFNGARKKERPDGSDAAGLSSSRGRGLEPCHAVGLSPGECAARLSSTSLLGQQRGAASSRRTDLRRSGAGATALTGGNDWWWASDADQAGNAGISGKSDRSSSGRDTQQAGRQSGRDAEQAGRHSRQESRTREGWPAARSSTWASRRAGGGGSSSSSRSSSGRGQWENSGGRRRPEGRQWPQDAQSSQRDGVPYADDDSSSNERGSGSRGLASMWIGDVVYGVSPVLAALQAGRREVHTLYIQEGLDLAKRKVGGPPCWVGVPAGAAPYALRLRHLSCVHTIIRSCACACACAVAWAAPNRNFRLPHCLGMRWGVCTHRCLCHRIACRTRAPSRRPPNAPRSWGPT